jgi:hypothetical protein
MVVPVGVHLFLTALAIASIGFREFGVPSKPVAASRGRRAELRVKPGMGRVLRRQTLIEGPALGVFLTATRCMHNKILS